MIDDKQIQKFFRSLKNIDKNMVEIEEFKNEIKKRQITFDENE